MMGRIKFSGFSTKIVVIASVVLALAVGALLLNMRMSKLDEDVVYAYYQQSINATRLFDAGTLCESMHPDYRMLDISKSPAGEERIALNRKQACDATRESMGMMRQVVAKLRVEPDFKYTIESVTLSPDRKQATVKMRAAMRIGKALSVTSSGTETLVRRFGKVLSLGTDTKTTISMK